MLARHRVERMSQSLGTQLLGRVLAAGVGVTNPTFSWDFAQLYGLGTSAGVILPWGRAQESEAITSALF